MRGRCPCEGGGHAWMWPCEAVAMRGKEEEGGGGGMRGEECGCGMLGVFHAWLWPLRNVRLDLSKTIFLSFGQGVC